MKERFMISAFKNLYVFTECYRSSKREDPIQMERLPGDAETWAGLGRMRRVSQEE